MLAAVADMATAGSTPQKGIGRPRKQPYSSDAMSDLVVTVQSSLQSKLATYAECGGRHGNETAVLSIPNCLLHCWHSQVTGGSGRRYIDYVNDHIIGEILKLDRTSERLETTLYRRANSLYTKSSERKEVHKGRRS